MISSPLIAKNTVRAYKSDFIQYQTWCFENRLVPTLATADTMAMYVDYLSENNKSATTRRRINSLGTVLKLSKNHDPTKDPEVVLALKQMHRKIRRAQQQTTPLTKPLLNRLLCYCDNNLRSLRNKVLLRLGYASDAGPSSTLLSLRASAKHRAAIRLNFSKTDQFGTGKILPISQKLFDLLEK